MTSTLIKVTWHVVTITFLSFGGLLLMIAGMPLGEAGELAVRAIGLTFALATIMVLWLARRRPMILVQAPMWLLFVATGVLCWWGAAR